MCDIVTRLLWSIKQVTEAPTRVLLQIRGPSTDALILMQLFKCISRKYVRLNLNLLQYSAVAIEVTVHRLPFSVSYFPVEVIVNWR